MNRMTFFTKIHAGVVNQDFNGAKFPLHSLHHLIYRVYVAYIPRVEFGLSATAIDLRSSLNPGAANIVHRYHGAVLCKCPCDCPPNPLPGACDQRCSSSQVYLHSPPTSGFFTQRSKELSHETFYIKYKHSHTRVRGFPLFQ